MGTPVGSVPAVVQQASGNQGGNPALIGRQFQPVQPIPGAATPGNTPTTGAPAVVNAAVNDTRPDPWDNVVQLLSSQTGSNGAGAGAATAGAAPMAAMGAAPGAAPGVATGFQPIQVCTYPFSLVH
jgi:hypothetical protein